MSTGTVEEKRSEINTIRENLQQSTDYLMDRASLLEERLKEILKPPEPRNEQEKTTECFLSNLAQVLDLRKNEIQQATRQIDNILNRLCL